MRKYKVNYTARSPIAHGGEENLSNIQPIRRQTIVYNGKNVDIPIISGNSIRGKNFRRNGMKKVCELLKIGKESLGLNAYHLLFNGGSLTKGDEKVDIGKKIGLRNMLPFVSVLGGGIGNMLLEGRMNVGFVYPVGFETHWITGIDSDMSVFECLDTINHTRHDDYEGTEEGETVQMLYDTEILIPGTKLYQEIVTFPNTELEESCIALFFEGLLSDPYIGGANNKGLGFVDIEIDGDFGSSELIRQHLTDNRDEIIAYLNLI